MTLSAFFCVVRRTAIWRGKKKKPLASRSLLLMHFRPPQIHNNIVDTSRYSAGTYHQIGPLLNFIVGAYRHENFVRVFEFSSITIISVLFISTLLPATRPRSRTHYSMHTGTIWFLQIVTRLVNYFLVSMKCQYSFFFGIPGLVGFATILTNVRVSRRVMITER